MLGKIDAEHRWKLSCLANSEAKHTQKKNVVKICFSLLFFKKNKIKNNDNNNDNENNDNNDNKEKREKEKKESGCRKKGVEGSY